VRTSLYQTAILSNSAQLFEGKTVMDLGAGSGILSYFAVKSGAERVFAVEASGMADKIQKLMDHTGVTNTWLKGKLEVIKGLSLRLLRLLGYHNHGFRPCCL